MEKAVSSVFAVCAFFLGVLFCLLILLICRNLQIRKSLDDLQRRGNASDIVKSPL